MKDEEYRKQLEEKARELGATIQEAISDPNIGFALFVFEYGSGGWLTWLSNAEREGMKMALRELLERMDGGGSDISNLN